MSAPIPAKLRRPKRSKVIKPGGKRPWLKH